MAENKTAPVTLPKRVIASKVAIADPGYRKEQGATIPDNESALLNLDINALRTQNPIAAIRVLTRTNGTFSTALHNFIMLAMSGYKVKGFLAGTHQFDTQATLVAQSVLASLDTLYDYSAGFASKQSVEGLLETLLKEVMQTGACSCELVLNKFRLPESLLAVPVTSLQWKAKSDGQRYPQQQPIGGGGDPIDLDIPTFFWAAATKASNSIYNRSPFESALNMLFIHQEFLQDIFRVIRRSGHSRVVVKILQEAVQKVVPPEIQNDPEALAKFYTNVRTEIEDVLKQLEPDDALVMYDTAETSVLRSDSDKADYAAILDTVNGMLATALKSVPSILGMRLNGSQSLSNTESLTYLKMVSGMRQAVETVLSRALTLAVRLVSGIDSYVKFQFNPIDLRPESELVQHRSIQQQIVLNRLSIGHLSDDEAAFELGTFPRPPGAPDLSGTMFMNPSSPTQSISNATGGPQEKAMASDTSNGSANPNPGGAN